MWSECTHMHVHAPGTLYLGSMNIKDKGKILKVLFLLENTQVTEQIYWKENLPIIYLLKTPLKNESKIILEKQNLNLFQSIMP